MSEASETQLTRELFAGEIGSTFHLDTEPPVKLELVEATATGGESDAREPFSLVFLGPVEPTLHQATFSMRHEALGELLLFLVPLGPDEEEKGMRYEAVFS